MLNTHLLMGDKLHVYQRPESPFWFCSTFLSGRNHRKSTKERSLEHAKKIAEEWYLSLQLKHRTGELRTGHSFKEAADKFFPEYEALTKGERNPRYVKNQNERLKKHLIPYFGLMAVTDINPQTVQDYRVFRHTKPQSAFEREKQEEQKFKQREAEIKAWEAQTAKGNKPAKNKPKPYTKKKAWSAPARTTIHHEIVTLRHVLKTAQRLGWIKYVPDLSPPYRGSAKISHRAWFSLPEYNKLCEAVRERAKNPPKPRWRWECEQLQNFVVFMVNTGLRPDEAARLEFRDVEIVKDKATNETILEISVRGKRGVGYCKSMPSAVYQFEQLKKRKRAKEFKSRVSKGVGEGELVLPGPTDLLFPALRHHHLNSVLTDLDMKFDREKSRRSAYSLRHTYICLRLMEGADIYQVAKNCRTSVEMIEKYYASHIKNLIDTASVNVVRAANAAPPQQGKANAKTARNAKGRGYPRRRG